MTKLRGEVFIDKGRSVGLSHPFFRPPAYFERCYVRIEKGDRHELMVYGIERRSGDRIWEQRQAMTTRIREQLREQGDLARVFEVEERGMREGLRRVMLSMQLPADWSPER